MSLPRLPDVTSILGRPAPTIHKHVVVREHVRELAAAAAPGTSMPSERELVHTFGVARMTVRHALEALVAEGVLQRAPGRGTFVARPEARRQRVLGFAEEMATRGRHVESRTVAARLERPGGHLARALGVGTDQPIVHWHRLRTVDGRPGCSEDAFVPTDVLPGFLERGPAGLPRDLVADLAARGLRPTWLEDTTRAVLTDGEQALLLGCAAGQPALRVVRRAGRDERVLFVSRMTYHPDGHTLSQRHDTR